MKRFILPVLVAVLIVGIATFACLHGTNLLVLNPQGTIGQQERYVIYLTTFLSAIVVIPVFIILFAFAWVYRADNPRAKKEHEPNWDHDNWIAETVWWFVPTVIIIILSFVAWQSAHQLDPYIPLKSANPPINVEVVALDWKWLFIYPDQHIATVNMLEFPENTPVHFELTADAPMNSFWIPSLGSQIMVMPGMSTQLNLEADTIGTYNGLSANISGDGFAGMTFTAQSVSKSDFDAWVASHQDASPLTSAAYAALAKPSEYNAPEYYSLPTGESESELYTSIMMSYMMPASQKAQTTQMTMPAMATSSMQDMNDTSSMPDMPGMQMSPN